MENRIRVSPFPLIGLSVSAGPALAAALLLTLLSPAISLDAPPAVVSTDSSAAQDAYLRSILSAAQMRPVPCGTACMAMALKILDVEFTDAELSDIPVHGGESDFGGLYDFARRKGLFAEAVKIRPQDLERLHNVAILQQFPPARSLSRDEGFHMVVFAGPAKEPGCVYIYDPVAANGWRGPENLDILSHKLTGKALVLSRFPLDLSKPLGAAHIPGRGYFSVRCLVLVSLALAFLAVAAVLFAVSRKKTANRAASTLLVLIAVLTPLSTEGLAAQIQTLPREESHAPPAVSKYIEGACVYDAGAVPVGRKLSHEFVVLNPTSAPIELTLGRSNCQCLSARIAGPSTLAPGAKTAVIVDVRTEKGGKRVSWVELKLSGEQDPILLRVNAVIIDDTLVYPETLTFSESASNAPARSRTLRFVHLGRKDMPFKITVVTPSASSLSVSPIGNPIERELVNGVLEYTSDIDVVLQPDKAPQGPFREQLSVTATVGTDERLFTVTCVGLITGTVIARPSKIVKIEKVMPEEFDVSVALQSADNDTVAVDGVSAEGIDLTRWTQEPGADKTSAVISLHFKAGMTSDHKEAVCKVTFAGREGEILSIPVLLVELGSDGPG